MPKASGRNLVISQPMLFPWVGMLEQVKCADVYVHYDDVQFSKGSFVNRVQLPVQNGHEWLTIPLKKPRLSALISGLEASPNTDWKAEHRRKLQALYNFSPYRDEMLALVDTVYGQTFDRLVDILAAGLNSIFDYFDLLAGKTFLTASELDIMGSGSSRVLAIAKELNCDNYITGHGAARYLDHVEFERQGVKVSYMNYNLVPYAQAFEPFNPFVSSLDLIANCGRQGSKVICSETVYWRNFLDERNNEFSSRSGT